MTKARILPGLFLCWSHSRSGRSTSFGIVRSLFSCVRSSSPSALRSTCLPGSTSSKTVGAISGLTPRRHQWGEIERTGGISKCGDAMMRTRVFEAAQAMLTRTIKWSWHKAWGIKIARHRESSARSSPWHGDWQSSCTACGWMTPSFAGQSSPKQREQSKERTERRNQEL
jgi:hypothetical protein